MRARSALAAAALVVVAACSSPSDAEEATDALTARLAADPVLADYEVDDAVAECTAEAMVADLGATRVDELVTDDEVRSAGLPAERLDDDELMTLADALTSCLDTAGVDVTPTLAGAVADGVGESATDEFPLTDDEAACVGTEVVDALGVPAMLTLALAADADVALDAERADAFVAAFLACTDVRSRVLAEVGAGDIDAEVLACLDVAITDEQVAELFALSFRDDEASETRAAEVLQPSIDFCTS